MKIKAFLSSFFIFNLLVLSGCFKAESDKELEKYYTPNQIKKMERSRKHLFENILPKIEKQIKKETIDMPDGSRLFRQYHPNGKLWIEISLKNGKPDGIRRDFYASGQLLSETTFKAGKKEGFWNDYYENGQLWCERAFKNDELDGIFKVYYLDGKLKSEACCYKDDRLNGIFKVYDENGKLLSENSWKNGILDGEAKHFDKNGNLVNVVVYKDGRVVEKKFYSQ